MKANSETCATDSFIKQSKSRLSLIVSRWETESLFFKGVSPGRLTKLQWKTTLPRLYGQHKLRAELKKEYIILTGMEEDIYGKIRGKYDQNNHMKLSMN